MLLKTHRSLVDGLCTRDAGGKVQDISFGRRCHGKPCVGEMLQHFPFAGNTGAMHVQNLGGLEVHAILDLSRSFH